MPTLDPRAAEAFSAVSRFVPTLSAPMLAAYQVGAAFLDNSASRRALETAVDDARQYATTAAEHTVWEALRVMYSSVLIAENVLVTPGARRHHKCLIVRLHAKVTRA